MNPVRHTTKLRLGILNPNTSIAMISFADTSTSLQAEQSREAFLAQTVALTGSILFAPTPAHAAKYGGFGAGSPEVLDPADADVDQSILKSDTVQSALRKVKDYQSAVRGMQSALETNPQTNVRSVIIKDLDFASLRSTLNTVNSAFEEDTQRGTDRLIRVIMQDITELEAANNQKEGVERSQRRLDIMKGKLAKLDQAFSDYLAFAK